MVMMGENFWIQLMVIIQSYVTCYVNEVAFTQPLHDAPYMYIPFKCCARIFHNICLKDMTGYSSNIAVSTLFCQ